MNNLESVLKTGDSDLLTACLCM